MKEKNIIDHAMRDRIAAFLPGALEQTITSYEDMMSGKLDKAARTDLTENQKAAKVAINHIELLMKLAGMAALPREGGDDIELEALLMQASAELDKYQEGEGDA